MKPNSHPDNPYAVAASTEGSAADGPPVNAASPWRSAFAAAIPITAICALLFRFPIPFAGYISGIYAVRPALTTIW